MILPKIRKFAARKGVGAMMVPTNLLGVNKIQEIEIIFTYCISKGVSNAGLILDHTRALQPRISRIPARRTVGSSHHMRNLTACKRWIAAKGGEKVVNVRILLAHL